MTPAEAAAADPDQVLSALGTGRAGLSSAEAKQRLERQGPNAIGVQSRSLNTILVEQVRNGINLLLAGAGVLTIVTGTSSTAPSSWS